MQHTISGQMSFGRRCLGTIKPAQWLYPPSCLTRLLVLVHGIFTARRLSRNTTFKNTIVVLAVSMALSPNCVAGELEELRVQIERMQEHHQGEIATLRAQLEALAAQMQHETAVVHGSVDGRISEIQQEVEDIQAEHASIDRANQDGVDLNLYATLEYENFEKTDSVFDARNVEMILSANLGERLSARAEIEFERTAKTSGSSARTGEVEVEQGWLQYYINQYFQPRFGVILVPFGQFNSNHFDVTRELTDRPLVMRRVVPVTWSEAGAGFSGEINLGTYRDGLFDNLDIVYEAYVINGLTNEFTDSSMRNARGGFGKDNNNNKALVGNLRFHDGYNFNLGFSGYTGHYDNDDDDAISGFGVDFFYRWKDVGFLGEYARFDLDDGFESDGVTAVPETFYGFYLQANYQFWPEILNGTFLSRDFSNPTLTASVRYGMAHIDDDGDAGLGDNEEKRWTLGLNYRPVESYVFKSEYQFNSTDNEALERGDLDGFILSVSAVF